MSKRRRETRRQRRGMSLLELVIASSLLAMLVASVAVVLRTGRQAWEAHEGDYTRIEAAHATLRHIVREIRQADAVTSITPSTDYSGRLSLLLPSGDVKVWDHDGNTNLVNYGITNPDNLLAPDVTGLRFIGYEADAQTPTTVPGEVQCLEVEVTIQLPRETNGTRVVRSWAWVRSW